MENFAPQRPSPKASEIPIEEPLTQFLLERISSFDELNAASSEEGERAFRFALMRALEKERVQTDRWKEGTQFLVQKLAEGGEGVVVKRLKSKMRMYRQGELKPEQYFAVLREQHNFILSYFGHEFVPATEFLEVRGNFGDPRPDLFLSGREFVMIQEEISGINPEDTSAAFPMLSEAMQAQVREFVRYYEAMQYQAGAIIENQIIINPEKGSIKISDTNHPIHLADFLAGNRFLAMLYREKPFVIRDSRDVCRLLAERIPELSDYSEKEFNKMIADLEVRTPKGNALLHSLTERWGEDDYTAGYLYVVQALGLFPVSGHNSFISRLLRKLHMEES